MLPPVAIARAYGSVLSATDRCKGKSRGRLSSRSCAHKSSLRKRIGMIRRLTVWRGEWNLALLLLFSVPGLCDCTMLPRPSLSPMFPSRFSVRIHQTRGTRMRLNGGTYMEAGGQYRSRSRCLSGYGQLRRLEEVPRACSCSIEAKLPRVVSFQEAEMT